MAWSFDGSNDYVDLSASTATDFADADWTVGGLVKVASLAGTESSAILYDKGSFPADGTIAMYVYQDSWGTVGERGNLQFAANDEGVVDSVGIQSSGNPFTSNTNWTHMAIRRASSVFTMWIDGAQVGTDTNAAFDAISPDTAIRLGATFNLSAGRFWNGSMAEWGKWSRALSDAEIGALANFFAPSFFRNGIQWHLPMIRDYVELKSGLTVTNNGTIVAPHPPIIYPAGPYIIQAPSETHTFTGSETISFDGTAALVQTAALTGAETVSFDGTADTILNEWRMTGAETVSFDGTADTIRNHWLMTGAESVSFDGSSALKQEAVLTGGETLSFDGTASLDIAALLFEGSGVLSFDGSIATLNAILKMQANAALSFDGSAALEQQATFVGGATLSFDGLADLTAFEWDAVDAATSTSWSDVD